VARNVSVTTRLAASIVIVAIVSLLAVAIIGLGSAESLALELAEARSEAIRASKADEIEGYLNDIQVQTAVLAGSPMTVDATRRFTDAYAELAQDGTAGQQEIGAVAAWYRDEFVPDMEDVRNEDLGVREFVPANDAGVYLQNHYIVRPDEFKIRARAVDDAEDGSTWSEVHSDVHPAFRNSLDQLGFEDLYIIEPETRAIVYSTNKAPDFATSLDVGPHSGSTLALLVDRIGTAPQKGDVVIVDFAQYAPSLDDPVGFLGSPIFDNGEFIGVLAARLPTAGINEIMTGDGEWEAQGFGETGEAYLVGPSGRMRSDARPFIEDPQQYVAEVEEIGSVSADEARRIETSGTTILFQQVDTSAIEEAAAEGDVLVDSTNYLERDVLSTFETLELEDLDWSLVTQVERPEATQGIDRFRRNQILIVALFVVTLAFLAVVWADRVIDPVHALSARLRNMSAGGAEAAAPESGESEVAPRRRGPREFRRLSESIDGMIRSLRERRSAATAASAERLDVIRSLLPDEIVKRIEAGDRRVLDQVPSATVVTLAVDGLGRLVSSGEAAENRRAIDVTVDTLDSLAEQHGVERIKLVGDTYFAVCGLTTPYLDHAPRAVAFALEVRDAVPGIDFGGVEPLEVAAGVHSGPVTAGLAGSARLIYDLWGPTVGTAHYLARSAHPGTILVSEDTKLRLPPSIIVEPRDGPAGAPPVWAVTNIAVEAVET